MATLQQLSSIKSASGRGNVFLQLLLQTSPVLRFLDGASAWEEDATSFMWKPATGTSAANARAINASFTASNLAPDANLTGTLAIHGDAVAMDVSYKADGDRGLRQMDKWFGKELVRRAVAFAKSYESALFNGSGTSNAIKGLKAILSGSDLPGFTGETRLKNAKDVASSGNSLDISTTAGLQKFIELLLTELKTVENPLGILLNRSLSARLFVQGKSQNLIGSTTDVFNQQLTTFQNVPIVEVLDDTITSTEPDDAGTPVNNTTSVYIMSPGEMRASVVTNSGLDYTDFDHMDAAEKGKEVYEIRGQWKVEEYNAVKRIRNIKL